MKSKEPVRAMLIPLHAESPQSGVSISDVLREFRQRWLLIVGAGVLCLLIAIVIDLTADRLYRASTTFVIANQSQGPAGLGALGSQIGGLASLAGLSLPDSDGLREEALATLESRRLVREFILEEDLLPTLFNDQWDADKARWSTDSGKAPSESQAVRFFREKVMKIDRDPGSNVVQLSIIWTDPQLSESWANGLVKRIDDDLRERARDEAQKSIEFLQAELARSSNTELHSTVSGLIEQNMATIMMANVRPNFAFRIIDPATVPDVDDPVWPRFLYIILAAFVVWLVISGMIVLLLVSQRNKT